nr:M14 family metallopeptidase [Flammeovirga kamogawensis]
MLLNISCTKSKTPQQKEKQEDWVTPFEKSNGLETFTYEEGIAYFKKLGSVYDEFRVFTYGDTDAGKPIHLGIYSSQGAFVPSDLKKSNVLLINNAIHPGEPDGVDASMMLLRDILQKKSKVIPKNTIIAVIPFYNIGGALNRNSGTRANQEGPTSYGFRGNAQNLDLNRDFIKMDSKNMKTLAEIIHVWQPDLFIDTHVSNGADYQYTLTYLASHEEKLGGVVGEFVKRKMNPYLEEKMLENNLPIAPYVNVWGTTPDKGYIQFFDSPRYSSGYTALFNTPSYVIETHMLKPFKQRTEATYLFLENVIGFLGEYGAELKENRKAQFKDDLHKDEFPIAWEVDKSKSDTIFFKGYEGKMIKSEVSGLPRLFYDRTAPYEKAIPFYSSLKVTKYEPKPLSFIIPRGWKAIIDLLKLNGVKVTQLKADEKFAVDVKYIESYKTVKSPYEGHYLHHSVKTITKKEELQFFEGDYLISADQKRIRFLMEVLTPEAMDSYFAWNFFDPILQQKEHFSAYVFEDKAAEMIKADESLRIALDKEIKKNPSLKNDAYAQLNFIYERSDNKEKSYLRYPVFKFMPN